MLKILYLVPNLSDPAVKRRVEMLQMGGAEVEVAGFRRADAPAPELPVGLFVEIDRTHDARFVQRLAATFGACLSAGRWSGVLTRPDVIIARNLEMLAVANRILGLWGQPPELVYECLDIHRLLLRSDLIGGSMRRVEQALCREVSLLMTSSPAFLRNYFDDQAALPALLVENKVLLTEHVVRGVNPALPASSADDGWRIGWFGALRCHKSLTALTGLARDGGVDVILRGRPARTEFIDFDGTVSAAPNVRFEGAYRNPDDLAAIYSEVHFIWAIDCFEEGQNSQWLLPNRIYEGCFNGAIPIALAGTETAAFIERQGIGVIVPDIEARTLQALFAGMTPERVRQLAAAVAEREAYNFACGAQECREIVDRLASLTTTPALLEEAA